MTALQRLEKRFEHLPEEDLDAIVHAWAAQRMGNYREYMGQTGHPDFMYPHARHHQIMAEALERIEAGDLKRLIIQLPPGAAKSTITSIQFATWYWALHPERHILRCSATDSLARKFARRCYSAIATDQWQHLAGVTLDRKRTAADHFANSQEGTMTAAGVGSSIVGLRSHLSILDDPVASFEQINSETQRNNQIEWYFAEYRSRIIPGGAEVIVTTRWHPQDIVGYILDSDEADTWEVIRIPMEADDEDDPLGRNMGERLWPEWFTDQMVKEAKRDQMRWYGMYQQIPLSDKGDWLSPDDLEIVDHAPPGLGMYAAVDLATSDGKGDFTVHVIAGMAEDGVMYIIDMVRERVTPDHTVQRLITINQQYQLREVLIDDDLGAKNFMPLAHKILLQEGHPVPLNPLPTKGNDKETRALAFRGMAKMGGVKLVKGDWNGDLLFEVNEFPFGKNDDIIDCLSLLGRRAAKMSYQRNFTPKTEEIQVAYKAHDGGVATTSTLNELWEDHGNWKRDIIRI